MEAAAFPTGQVAYAGNQFVAGETELLEEVAGRYLPAGRQPRRLFQAGDGLEYTVLVIQFPDALRQVSDPERDAALDLPALRESQAGQQIQ